MVPSLATDEKNMAQHYKALDAEMGFERRIFNSYAPSITTHSCLKKNYTNYLSYQLSADEAFSFLSN